MTTTENRRAHYDPGMLWVAVACIALSMLGEITVGRSFGTDLLWSFAFFIVLVEFVLGTIRWLRHLTRN